MLGGPYLVRKVGKHPLVACRSERWRQLAVAAVRDLVTVRVHRPVQPHGTVSSCSCSCSAVGSDSEAGSIGDRRCVSGGISMHRASLPLSLSHALRHSLALPLSLCLWLACSATAER